MDFILSVKNAKLYLVNLKSYLITGTVKDLSLRVSYGKNILMIKNMLLTLTINDKDKDNYDSLLIEKEYMDLNQEKDNNNLDYIGGILDNIFNQLTFKIYKINLNIKSLDISCRFRHVYLKPSTDNIYIKLKEFKIFIKNPFKISIKFYKIKGFIVYNLTKISVKYLNCLSLNINCNIKKILEKIEYLSNSNSNSSSYSSRELLDIFSQVNLNLDHLFINDTSIKIGLQLNRLVINKDKIIFGLIRFVDKERVYIYLYNVRLIKYKYLIIKHINYHLNYKFIDYLREISYLISHKFPNNYSHFLEDNTSETIISDTINIIDDYLGEAAKTGTNNIPTIMNKSMKSICKKKKESFNNIVNFDNDYNTFDYVCDDYFQFVHINKSSTSDIDNNIIFSLCCFLGKVVIYDKKNNPITYIITNNIKYSLNKKKVWDFKLDDLKITDLTNSLWKNICYKISNDYLIKIKATQYNNTTLNTTHSGNSYYIDIKIEKFAINLDELFLKTIIPVIENINEIFNYLNNVFSGKPLYIIQCLVSHINTVLSYKPRDLNIGSIINGNKQELIKLGTIRDMDINFTHFTVTNTFGLGELLQTIMVNLEKDLTNKGSIILGHVGILKQIFSPGLRANQILNMEGNILDKAKKYARFVSSDALELASRTTISIETAIETVLGKTDNNSKLQKRKLLENIDLCIIIKGITMSLLNLQHKIDPKQRDRNKMRYG